MLEIKGISKSYGNIKVLNNISLTISKGSILGLLGINGAGKSTLINILSCFIEPDNGDILLEGVNIKSDIDKYKVQIGIVPQDIALYQNLSAYDNLLFWGSLYNIPEIELIEAANSVLNQFGMYNKRYDKIKTYSGGMKRKINIACSILHNPKLLLLDEPTVGLDPQSTIDTIELIEGLNSKGMTILYTTHYMKVAERLCDKIAIIESGSIMAEGTLADLRLKSGAKDSITIKIQEINAVIMDKLKMNPSKYTIDNLKNTICVRSNDIDKDIVEIVNCIHNNNGKIMSIESASVDLESIFMNLTGKTLKS